MQITLVSSGFRAAVDHCFGIMEGKARPVVRRNLSLYQKTQRHQMQDTTNAKSAERMRARYKIVIICGIVIIAAGLGSRIVIPEVLYPPTYPPHMKPVNGMFWISHSAQYYARCLGLAGIPILITGMVLGVLR